MSDTGRNRLNWAQTAINLAYDIAKYRSEDPYVQVGACIIKKDKSMLLGYNGAPSGVDIDWANRDKRRARVLHAEANVLNFVKPNEVELLACTHLPCTECLKVIAQKQIDKVYFAEYLDNYDSDATIELANEFGIELSQIISTDL
jgi:dCMP deaminase|tara:strand:- start:14743 stop:15177 length:435 start_codon:yes stop_codon:yes gene_type:complete